MEVRRVGFSKTPHSLVRHRGERNGHHRPVLLRSLWTAATISMPVSVPLRSFNCWSFVVTDWRLLLLRPSDTLLIRRIEASWVSDSSGMSEKSICDSEIGLSFLASLRRTDGRDFFFITVEKFFLLHTARFPACFRPTRTSVRNASFTDSDVGNTFATSGESTTTLLPSA